MRFLMTTTAGDPPDEKMVAEMDRLVEEMTRKGVLLAAGGLDPLGTRVTSSGGRITVTDGPFTESKEVIGGWAILNADSKADAVRMATEFMELHRKYWPGFEGESEVRPMFDPGMGP